MRDINFDQYKNDFVKRAYSLFPASIFYDEYFERLLKGEDVRLELSNSEHAWFTRFGLGFFEVFMSFDAENGRVSVMDVTLVTKNEYF